MIGSGALTRLLSRAHRMSPHLFPLCSESSALVGAGADAVAASLRELDALHASGLLSLAEYEAKRAEILSRI